MKIYLFLEHKMLMFSLPSDISGSFGFYKTDEESDLINIEAKDNQWVLYSTDSSKLIINNCVTSQTTFVPNNFYILKNEDKYYLIYSEPLFESGFTFYEYDRNINLIIGANQNNNIFYNCPFIRNLLLNISYDNDKLLIKPNVIGYVYVNKRRLTGIYEIKTGDEIDVCGLRLIFLENTLIINKAGNKAIVNSEQANIKPKAIAPESKIENIETKDVDLYNKENYFTKSPRLRRLIETKEMKLSAPPKQEKNEDLPVILTVGPMLTMGVTSAVSLLSAIIRISNGETEIKDTWPSLVTSGAMLLSMVLWPNITKMYNKRIKKRKNKEIITKYSNYLSEKRKELDETVKLQREILVENLVSVEACLKTIQNKSTNLWDKRVDQSDFLVTRIGVGNELLDAKISYSEEDFSIDEDQLRKQADAMVEEYKYIKNVPIGYSFYDNKITAIMGNKKFAFTNNIILQLLSFYSYDDLKFVILTNEKNESNWKYMKYLNHNFSNNKRIRFFASNEEDIKKMAEILNMEVNNRLIGAREQKRSSFKPHYIVIIDDYDSAKRHDFIKTISEVDENIGFSLIILEEKLNKLPSKCNNFIYLGEKVSGVLKNSFEKQEQQLFQDEINTTIDMMAVAKILSNIPIEFEEGLKNLPDSITFLEMEKVGKVEQLNILNRWKTNDATSSLKAEIGVDENESLLYLDLHEKAHGPHGLIAGMTGSGKSEFIITYILSMAINYSPEDVAFILIDYKGGGLAGAFENKVTGISLPHLAGTITNLDKAEMDRTLVSIDSEVKRRQAKFNEARDMLGESTVDIYKYQKFFKEGKLSEPIPHLFVICDEFAELKSQQPDFMDNLISIARIGRSLGVHLILATQKPSGVVTDQIWSNSKFHICLKVQDEADSKEMLKKPDAAGLKQTGRFYLQVGYDEYFVLGQSGWCGAKYYPSDKIEKQVDKSINFINDIGGFIKSIQSGTNRKTEAQGEQISAIMKIIIEVATKTGKFAKRLWLDNIDENSLVAEIENKYSYQPKEYDVISVIGEYDAPEKQTQGIIKYNYLENGNTIIYGNDGSEKEDLIGTLIYSATKNHKASEINFYIIDYGSESLRCFEKIPHVGGIIYASEEEKYNNLIKLVREELKTRKKLFAEYGGEYKTYIANSNNKMPLKVVILNNYDSIFEANPNLVEDISDMVRDSERYGVIFIISCNSSNSVSTKLSRNFNNYYAFKLKDLSDYQTIFGGRLKSAPRDIFGRGLYCDEAIHEFQTAKITKEKEKLNQVIISFANELRANNQEIAPPIPILPDMVTMEEVSEKINNLMSVPIGISKKDLEICTMELFANVGNLISSNKLINTKEFVLSLLEVFKQIPNINILVLDPLKLLPLNSEKFPYHYMSEFDKSIDSIIEYIQKLKDDNIDCEGVILIYGINKLINKLNDKNKLSTLITEIKEYEKIAIILVDEPAKIKSYAFEPWFNGNFSMNDGLWIGKGMADQNLLHVTTISRDMTQEHKNNMGYLINESTATLCKLIDFVNIKSEDDIDEE